MYEVYCDGQLMYNTKVDDKRYILHDAKLDLELNKAGSFDFTIFPSHAGYDTLNSLKSIITVYQDDYLIFRGRVLNTAKGFYNQKQVFCEGELAFLCDSIQRPCSLKNGLSNLLSYAIVKHNEQVDESKQFIVGRIDLPEEAQAEGEGDDKIVTIEDYCTTWDFINERLIEPYGGYLWVRHEDDGNYIDYIQNFDTLSNQPIKFGKNLLSFKKESKGEDVATALIPLGKDNISINSVNDHVDYIYNEEAVKKYGWIFKVETYDDIESEDVLLAKAKKRLKELSEPLSSIEVGAADLSSIEDYNAFHLGTYVTADSSPHDLNANFIVKKLQITLAKPSANKLTLDGTFETFTQTSVQKLKPETIKKSVKNEVSNSMQSVNAQIEELNGKLELVIYTDANGVVQSAIGAEADIITFNSNKLIIDSTNFTLSEDGTIKAVAGQIGNWVIGADDELNDYVIRNNSPLYKGSISYTTTGADYYTLSNVYVFTVLRSTGISYVVKEGRDYSSATKVVLSSFNSNSTYFKETIGTQIET